MVTPRATYRLQLSPATTFHDAADLVPYLAELGVSHLHLSPCLEARAGSPHGYDVVDFERPRSELGGSEGLLALFEVARRHGLGILLDFVPNHMAAAPESPWWRDVLESGRASPWASCFDIDWEAASATGGLILPVLGDQYGRLLENGEIRVARAGVDFTVRYADHAFPLAPDTLAEILVPAAERCGSDRLGLAARALAALAPSDRALPQAQAEQRQRDVALARGLLDEALAESATAGAAVDEELARLQADPDRLDAFLGRQPYRLAFWRMAGRALAYRRFFDIDGLVALRMEDPRVFEATHTLVLRWLRGGLIDGIRVDHIDGLRDPEAYLHRLRGARPEAWILVEKILEPDETLPGTWPVDGTTGYDFLQCLDGLFVDPAGRRPLSDLYAGFTGEQDRYGEVLVDAKRLVLHRLFGSDLARLTTLFARVCALHRRHRDHTDDQLERVLVEAIARLPVYRTYVMPGRTVSAEDRRRIETCTGEAARALACDDLEDAVELLRDCLLGRHRGRLEDELVVRFQQLSGPAMAKGAEDTAFYVYHRFVARNEVGGSPDRFDTSADAFHRNCRDRLERTPRALLATSTHDTKRSEGVRARLALLSEMPEAWGAAVRRWSDRNARYRDAGRPDRNDEYLFYQTVVGAWPIETQRVVDYMEKAIREAKRRTSWRRPDTAYEDAVRRFVEGALGDASFAADLDAFVAPLVEPGRVNALSATLLKLVCPGVPDLYQGTEHWELSLVDPDNRRPVDWTARQRLLGEIADAPPEAVLDRADEGAPKQWLVHRALALRARRPLCFGPESGYAPLAAHGTRQEHVVALCRGGDVVAIVPRLVLGLRDGWKDTTVELPPGRFVDRLGGDAVHSGRRHVADLLARFPVALLERERSS